jgi:hypothetical protein
MITVIAYRNGQEVRHEQCSDLLSADVIADELLECSLYDEVKIATTGEDNESK